MVDRMKIGESDADQEQKKDSRDGEIGIKRLPVSAGRDRRTPDQRESAHQQDARHDKREVNNYLAADTQASCY